MIMHDNNLVTAIMLITNYPFMTTYNWPIGKHIRYTKELSVNKYYVLIRSNK